MFLRPLIPKLSGPVKPTVQSANALSFFLPKFHRSIWIHALHPDQFEALGLLIESIRSAAPQFRVVLTSFESQTLAWAKARFPTDTVLAAPRNSTVIASHFFKRLNPKLILVPESVNGLGRAIFRAARKNRVSLVAVNVSAVQENLPGLTWETVRRTVASVCICVRNQDVADTVRNQGVPRNQIRITGNLNFAYATPTQNAGRAYLMRQLGVCEATTVILAEKILPPEDRLVLDVFSQLKERFPDAVLLAEPAGTGDGGCRFRRYFRQQFCVVRRSFSTRPGPLDIVLFDRPGEIQAFYRIASCILAGGSFSGSPSHFNPAGPIVCGRPVIFGPYLPYRTDAAEELIAGQAARQTTPSELLAQLLNILNDTDVETLLAQNAARILQRHSNASDETFAAIRPLIPSAPPSPLVKTSWRAPTIRDRFGQSPLWKLAARPLTRRRIENWNELKDRLNRPKSVLCLGNGPSSEDPSVASMEYDCLMRINWRWIRRGVLTRPHVVFVGDPATLQRLSGCIFAFWNIELETGMLLRRVITRGPRPIKYFTMQRICPLIRDIHWPARPTNGALMVAAAAALQPRRLVIAGIDLYRHPDGKYPGDFSSNNRYSQAHHLDTELAIMRRALEAYRGEVDIIGEPLQDALKNTAKPHS